MCFRFVSYSRPLSSLLMAMILLFFRPQEAEGRTVRYELVATEGKANISGKKTVDFALFLNGSLPAPTLEFTEGDDAEILVKNEIPHQEVSIHWHGILLPPEMDGVPYVNTPPIRSGESFTFRFKIRQSGTYWYHTHTNVQEQKGIYGALIIHPKQKPFAYDKDAVVVISDWSDEDALDILKNLRKDGDYYLYKKKTVRSLWGALQAGALGTYWGNEWDRMGGMDYSDVGYDAFLINGKRESQLLDARPGEKIRIRIINASASTYFHVALGQDPMQVISSDGVDFTTTSAKEILIGMAETYDLLFEVPERMNYELKATAQDGTGSASAWIGGGDNVHAPRRPTPNLYESMDHGAGHAEHASAQNEHAGHEEHAPAKDEHAGHGEHAPAKDEHAGHGEHAQHHGTAQAEPIVPILSVDALKALKPTAFPTQIPVHDVKLVLDGDMERYVWHINGKAIQEERTISIQEGEVVRFTFVNETMMHHPMHLHGHFFRVLNQYGPSSPLKHTVDVPPHSSRTIEFLANEPGEWMLHCHNLYHMKTGMARVIKYSSYTPSPEITAHQKHDPHNHEHLYFYGSLKAASNLGQARLRLSQTWNEIDAHIESHRDEEWQGEADILYRRWFGKYSNLALGALYDDHESYGTLGASLILPLLVESQILITHKGKVRLDLEKRLQWTSHVFSDVEASFRQDEKTDWEFSLLYAQSWSWALGAFLTAESSGLGAQLQF